MPIVNRPTDCHETTAPFAAARVSRNSGYLRIATKMAWCKPSLAQKFTKTHGCSQSSLSPWFASRSAGRFAVPSCWFGGTLRYLSVRSSTCLTYGAATVEP